MDYAYVLDEKTGYYKPQIVKGVFKGVRVDVLPLAKTLQQAWIYCMALPHCEVVDRQQTRVYFSISPDSVKGEKLREMRDRVEKQYLSDCGPIVWEAV